MSHLTDNQLMRHLRGDPSAETSSAICEHLLACPACQERFLSLRSVWNALGTWNPPQVSTGLEDRILQSLPAHTQPKTRNWGYTLRVAAAFALAVGLGHMVGRFSWKSPTPVPVDESAAAESLHLEDANTAEILLAAIDSPEGDQP